MERLCERLEEEGIDLSTMYGLEFFAREGNWHTVDYAKKIKELHAWEMNPQFRQGLERNLPFADIVIGDSFQLARMPEHAGMFNFIVFDNPQGLFGQDDCYCEHFEALDLVSQLMSDTGVVIFLVNKNPYDYEKHSEWKAAREGFYGISDTDKIDVSFLVDWYEEFFSGMGLRTVFSFEEKRNDYISYLVFSLARN
jgi:hypothetical protein